VWALHDRLVARTGPRPTLIERDDHLPAFDVLLDEREACPRRAARDGEGRMTPRRLPGRVRAGALPRSGGRRSHGSRSLAAQPAFAVYRNTVMKGCIDALEANFPAVTRLVGEEWFREAARRYVTSQLPREPWLLTYGATFPAFLVGYASAAGMPWLARWRASTDVDLRAHRARRRGAARGRPRPRSREPRAGAAEPSPGRSLGVVRRCADLHHLAAQPRAGRGRERDRLAWRGGADHAAHWRRAVDRARRKRVPLPQRVRPGLTVLQAMEAALEVDPDVDLRALVSRLIEAGAFSGLTTPTEVNA
jgi:hypothetical protein